MNNSRRDFSPSTSGKLRVFVLSKKVLLAIILTIVVIAVFVLGGYGVAHTISSSPATEYVVVLDPGHGGIDGGVVSESGYRESEFNLDMAKELRMFLEGAGFRVVLTREDDGGLYGDEGGNKKRADMAERKKRIEESNPDFVVSIHANKYPSKDRRGAQVFFDQFNDGGKSLATAVQSGLNVLNEEKVGRSFSPLAGDYFMLKCSTVPSIIVECGFLSNAEDEKLLSDEKYRRELAFAIYSGIVTYEGEKGTI